MPPPIRNFSIIAHIDHGKSTLADRMLLRTGAVDERRFREQMLDDMDLERERGITIKAKAVTLYYDCNRDRQDGQDGRGRPAGGARNRGMGSGRDPVHPVHPCSDAVGRTELNLVDTPGHVDFSYEVSRSLAACEGALLLVDATQGVEAQTVANAHLASALDLVIVPVVNKIDLATARPDETAEEIEEALALPREDVIAVSAKTGEGVDAVLDAIVERIPAPRGEVDGPLQALVFDATYDDYRGVVLYVRVVSGRLATGDEIRLLRADERHEALEVGQFRPGMEKRKDLAAGQIGYLITGVKSLSQIRVGETIAHVPSVKRGRVEVAALPGYREAKPMVFCGLYPANNTEFEALRKAIERLSLNDSSFSFEPESSTALGPGFRCGFLGLLHMEIVQERLERESGIDLVQTAPNVTFRVRMRSGEDIEVRSPADLPDPSKYDEILEPIIRTQIIVPSEHIGPVMKLCEERRGVYRKTEYIGPRRAILEYDLPMLEVVSDFYDRLKAVTRGYASMDYEFEGYKVDDLVKMDVLVHGERVDAFSTICHRSVADGRGRALIRRLKKEIPRHLFQIPLQAAIGGRIIARMNIPPVRKNVTAKCYGGDVSRKRKLLERQKEGKKRMKTIGTVNVPQEAFLAVLRSGEEE
ncbi:MAG: translation elongation factor 4 [Planctomycetota bacterium]|jgi:GTP-binding protein LepA